jgi:hypothetical protein
MRPWRNTGSPKSLSDVMRTALFSRARTDPAPSPQRAAPGARRPAAAPRRTGPPEDHLEGLTSQVVRFGLQGPTLQPVERRRGDDGILWWD